MPRFLNRLSSRLIALVPLGLLVALAACAPQAPIMVGPPASGAPADMGRIRVALLLPLSGQQEPLGRALQQATELALFEQNDRRVEFVPLDTAGTAMGAGDAARRAVSLGAVSMVGPLTGAETAGAAPVAQAARLPMLAFTNDASQARAGVWALGVTPEQQMRRVMGSAMSSGARQFGMVAPDDAFGRAMANAMRQAAADFNLPSPAIVLFNERAGAAGPVAEMARRATNPIDAVVIGATGFRARELAAAVRAGAQDNPRPLLLGHALWIADAGLANEPALHGALFPAPDERARGVFDARFQQAFGQRAPRIAGVAHDAAVMAAGLAVAPAGTTPDAMPRFDGVDGPVQLRANGVVDRSLALFRVSPNGDAVLVEPPMPLGVGF
ncbi:MAG: penicillin-binding protein activator [Roseomonas sp.]|nr:penicillin-binding protein activator [Roseomonas sp.]